MTPLKQVYRDVACLECKALGHPDPWPCAGCLCKFADAAIEAAEKDAKEAGRLEERLRLAKMAEGRGFLGLAGLMRQGV